MDNPYRFPQYASLRDGRKVVLRPFERGDVEALHGFFQRLPRKLRDFAWNRIDNRATVDEWARNIDYGKAFPLLALDGSKVVADATLHRRPHGPLRLAGRIKWLLDPEFRAIGLGSLMINHLIDLARANGLRHVSCMLISDIEEDAIKTLTELGFEAFLIPGYGSDTDGGEHDMTHLVFRV